MKKIFISAILLSLITFSTYSSPKLVFSYDYSFFKGNESNVFVELYYSFLQTGLNFIRTNNGFKAEGLIHLDILDNLTGKEIILKEFHIPLNIKDTAGYDKKNNLVGQVNILLNPGIYKMRIRAADLNDTANNSIHETELNVKMMDNNDITASSVQLASAINRSSNTESVFYKNTLEVVPNPSLLFGNTISKVHYYIEFYNLRSDNITNEYYVIASLTDRTGKDINSETFKYNLKSDSRVTYGSFDVNGLETGSYLINISLYNSKSVKKTESSKQFWIYNTDASSNITNENEFPEYVNFDKEMIDDEFQKTKYLMSDKLIDEFEKIKDLNTRKLILHQFWISLAPNLTRSEYLKRINYANKNFKNDYQEGWRTDRGRVYALYGPHSNIERFPFQANERAYEIWSYDNVQGGAVFVFIDISNNDGNYILAHSTARGELSDENWRLRLSIR